MKINVKDAEVHRVPVKARRVLEAPLKRVPDYPGAEALLESSKKSQ